MSDENKIVVVAPKDVAETKALAKDLAVSNLMPQVLRQKPADIMAIVIAGSEMGLAPMQSIRGLNIISGKISLSADLMGALCKSKPEICEYLQMVDSSAESCTYETKRKGNPSPTRVTYTMKDAQLAQLASNPNYKKNPKAMLRARCLSAICRAEYPDLCLGLYDSESGELEEKEKEVGGQTEHAERVKEEIRGQVEPKTEPLLKSKTEPEDAQIVTPVEEMLERVKKAATREELQALVPVVQKMNEADKQTVAPAYAARLKELKKNV